MQPARTKIVYIDDQEDLVESLAQRLRYSADIAPIPSSVDKIKEIRAEAETADIVVSDWDLKQSLVSANGLGYADGGALIEAVASWRRGRDFIHTIFSGQLNAIKELEEVSTPDFDSHRHILSRRLGVDWVGQKSSAESFYSALEALSESVQRINELTLDDSTSPRNRLSRLMAEGNAQPIDDVLAEEIPAFGPPKIDASKARRFDVVRWLLLEVLPYPTFLIDSYEVARRLRVNPSWFASEQSPLHEALNYAQYKGILHNAGMGKRWWARHVESALWELSNKQQIYGAAWKSKLRDLTVPAEDILSEADPVIIRGYFGVSTGKVSDVSETVRISPPHWPSSAAQAYAFKADVLQDPFLQQISDPNDLAGEN